MKKKILFALALLTAGSMVFAQSSETKSKSSSTSSSLDGKVFMVTLTDNSGSTGNEGTMYNDNPSVTRPDDANTQPAKGTKMDDGKAGKRMIIRFRNGEMQTSSKSEFKTENCSYTSWAGTGSGISFSANCNSGKSMNDQNGEKSSGNSSSRVDKSGDNSTAGTTGTTGTSGTSTGSGTTTGMPTGTSGTVDNTGATGSGSGANDGVYPGTGTTSGSAMGTTSPSAKTPNMDEMGNDLSSPSGSGSGSKDDRNNMQINGNVNGDLITGTLSCTKSDGSVKKYSFRGSTAKKSDLDMEESLGLK